MIKPKKRIVWKDSNPRNRKNDTKQKETIENNKGIIPPPYPLYSKLLELLIKCKLRKKCECYAFTSHA